MHSDLPKYQGTQVNKKSILPPSWSTLNTRHSRQHVFAEGVLAQKFDEASLLELLTRSSLQMSDKDGDAPRLVGLRELVKDLDCSGEMLDVGISAQR